MSQSTIEKLLGRPLVEKDRRTIPSLAELPLSLVDDARRLARQSRLHAVAFLQHYLVDPRLDDMADFIDEVLLGDGDLQAWVTRDRLCVPVLAWQRVLRLEAAELLAPIASVGESNWCRIVPRVERWYLESTGVPGIWIRRRYDWSPPENATTIGFGSAPPPLEPVIDLDVALSRWIASRIAWAMKAELATGLLTAQSAAEFFRVSADELSGLARHTIAALSRELAALGWSDDAIPGFRGPDSWYSPNPSPQS